MAKITLRGVQDRPGVAAAIFGPLADASINVDMIIQNVGREKGETDVTFTVPQADLARAQALPGVHDFRHGMDPRLVRLLDLDVRVVLTWDADQTDIDLCGGLPPQIGVGDSGGTETNLIRLIAVDSPHG